MIFLLVILDVNMCSLIRIRFRTVCFVCTEWYSNCEIKLPIGGEQDVLTVEVYCSSEDRTAPATKISIREECSARRAN